MPDTTEPPSFARRLAWFLGIAVTSAVVVVGVAEVLRFLLLH